MKKAISIIIALSLLLVSLAAAAESAAPAGKEEVVYGLLNTDGSVNGLTVVNILTGGGRLTDYGPYTAVQNLTGTEPLTQNGDEISVGTTAERFYYQGTLPEGAELPWNVAITYTLDGLAVTADELTGKSGEMGLNISVTQNPDADETFYLNDTLQISVLLDTALCDDIRAEGATVAEAAGQKQLTFTALPGQGAEIAVKATVHDFAMDPVSIAGVRMNLSIALDEDALNAQVTALTDAIASLDDGAGNLQSGAQQLSDGLAQYTAGVTSLTDGVGQLADGAAGLSTGAASLRDGLAGLTAQNDTLTAAATALQQSVFDAVNGQLAQSGQGLPTLTPENYAQVLGGVDALAAIKAQLDGVTQFTQGLQGYTAGVGQLSAGASALADGAATLSDSLAAVPDSAAPLSTSGTELATGAETLSSGLTTYKAGTAELRSQTDGLAESVGAQISDALGGAAGGGDAVVVSFVSPRNTNVSAVQFVLKTGAITPPKAVAEPEPEPEPETFWQKLTALFGF